MAVAIADLAQKEKRCWWRWLGQQQRPSSSTECPNPASRNRAPLMETRRISGEVGWCCRSDQGSREWWWLMVARLSSEEEEKEEDGDGDNRNLLEQRQRQSKERKWAIQGEEKMINIKIEEKRLRRTDDDDDDRWWVLVWRRRRRHRGREKNSRYKKKKAKWKIKWPSSFHFITKRSILK